MMRQSAALVERQLDRAQKQFNASDSERAALIAALMVAFETKKEYTHSESITTEEADAIRQMNKHIDDILSRTDFPAKA